MKKEFINYLCCPNCKGSLSLNIEEEIEAEIISGAISCTVCHEQYPIIKSIPRFIDSIKTGDSYNDLHQSYADSFGYEWTSYDWLREEDEYEFFSITGLSKENLHQKTILDVGCGGGRFARNISPLSQEFVGLDYSIAVDKAYELCKDMPNAHFLQCDINQHPLKNEMFDLVYSHGVLHHTPDTKQSFDKLPPLVKPNSILYIAVFRKAFFLLRWSDTLWRSVLNKLSYKTLDKVCGLLSLLSYLPFAVFFKRFFWFSLQKTHEIRKCCLFD